MPQAHNGGTGVKNSPWADTSTHQARHRRDTERSRCHPSKSEQLEPRRLRSLKATCAPSRLKPLGTTTCKTHSRRPEWTPTRGIGTGALCPLACKQASPPNSANASTTEPAETRGEKQNDKDWMASWHLMETSPAKRKAPGLSGTRRVNFRRSALTPDS